jgi:hypothetical protein
MVANDQRDDSAAVLAAVQAANAVRGLVIVRFPPGRFIITEILFIERGDIVIQGAGRGDGGTTLYFPRPLRIVDDTLRLDELRAYIRELDKRQREPASNLDVFVERRLHLGVAAEQPRRDVSRASALTPCVAARAPVGASAGRQLSFAVSLSKS